MDIKDGDTFQVTAVISKPTDNNESYFIYIKECGAWVDTRYDLHNIKKMFDPVYREEQRLFKIAELESELAKLKGENV